jgi:hypothetical protein
MPDFSGMSDEAIKKNADRLCDDMKTHEGRYRACVEAYNALADEMMKRAELRRRRTAEQEAKP